MCFQPTVQPLDGVAPVVDHLPTGGLLGLPNGFLVRGVWVNDGKRPMGPLY